MHDLGIAVDHHVIGDFDRADLGNSTEVIAAQIDQHVMLGKLLLIGKQLVLERLILLRRFAARTRARNREGGQAAVIQSDERFRRGTHDLVPINGEEHHVRRGVGGAEHAVRRKQAVLIRTGELPRLHGLKNIAVKDVLAGLFHDIGVLRLGDVAGEVRPAGCLERRKRCLVVDQPRHALERRTRLAVVLHHAVGLHVDDEHDLLLEVVIGDDLVEQHQVEIVPCATLDFERRLRVAEHRIREVADEAARKRGQAFDVRRAVPAEHLTQYGKRLVCLDRAVLRALERDRAVFAGRTEDGVVAEKGIACPLFSALYAFQKKEAVRARLKPAQKRDRRNHISVNLAADRNSRVFFCELYDFITAWSNHGVQPPHRILVKQKRLSSS